MKMRYWKYTKNFTGGTLKGLQYEDVATYEPKFGQHIRRSTLSPSPYTITGVQEITKEEFDAIKLNQFQTRSQR